MASISWDLKMELRGPGLVTRLRGIMVDLSQAEDLVAVAQLQARLGRSSSGVRSTTATMPVANLQMKIQRTLHSLPLCASAGHVLGARSAVQACRPGGSQPLSAWAGTPMHVVVWFEGSARLFSLSFRAPAL